MSEKPAITVRGRWLGGMKFLFEDGRGHQLLADAPATPGAASEGFRPGALMLAALAACSGIDVASILSKRQQKLGSLEVEVTGAQDPDPPWAFREIRVTYTLRGDGLDERWVERAIDLAENKYCSVGATMKGVAQITSAHQVVQTREQGTRNKEHPKLLQ